MAQLTGKDEDALASDLRGVIFRNPENKRWETADEYLSGNVREKLHIAQSAQNLFEAITPETWKPCKRRSQRP